MVKDKAFYRSIFRLSVPSAFQSLMTLLVVMADNAMVSFYNTAALGAVSQANSVTAFVTAAITGLASGSIVLISQYWGKKDAERIRRICAVVLVACVAVAALALLAGTLFPRAVLSLVINRSETEATALALEYFPVVCFSLLPFSVTAALVGALKGVEVVKVTLYASVVSLLSNVALNYALIFGNFGFPEMGVRGAAVATVLARCIECCVVCVYAFRVQKALPLRPRDFARHEGWAWRDYVRFGAPVGFTDAQWALVGMCKMVVIGQMGEPLMGAVAVTDMMLNLGTMFTFALAGGACVVVGKAVGARDYKRVREYSGTIQLMFFLFGFVMAALVFFLRKPFLSLYELAPDVKTLAETMIAICSVTLLGTTYHASCFVGINRGAGDNRFVMMVDLICGWLIVLPMAALAAFVFHWPPAAIYFCTRCDQCFKWIIAFFRLRGNKWIKNVTRE